MMIQLLNKMYTNIKNSTGGGGFNPLEIRVVNLLAGGFCNE